MNKILITIICLTVALGLGIGFVNPKYQEYKDIKKEIERKENELSVNSQYFENLRTIKERLKEYESSFTIIDCAFPSFFSIPGFFLNMQKISSGSGMILSQIGGGSINEKEEFKERSYSFSPRGTFSNFLNFLYALEKSAKIIEVEGFSFSFADGGIEDPISFDISIKTYSY